jgi:hypothetical protein
LIFVIIRESMKMVAIRKIRIGLESFMIHMYVVRTRQVRSRRSLMLEIFETEACVMHLRQAAANVIAVTEKPNRPVLRRRLQPSFVSPTRVKLMLTGFRHEIGRLVTFPVWVSDQ